MNTILIIEDDPLISRLYQQAFQFDGYNVVLSHNGQDGLEKVRSIKPTLVLLDIMLPKMNGFEILEKIKNDQATNKIPVIMLTNITDEREAQRALILGAVKYIMKSSYKPKQITEMVKQIIKATARDDIPRAV